jgi:prephenate dehydrogenase
VSGDGSRTVAVIGLGLVGGSLARDLAERGWRVVAAERDAGSLEAALASGVIEGSFDAGGHAEAALAAAEMVIVATPVRSAENLVRWLADAAPPGAVITDVASTKRRMMEAARESGLSRRFVGSHPMAGDHRSGWRAARTGLFAGARVWLCHDGADPPALDRVVNLWTALGAIPQEIDPAVHDQLLAWSSHLPQLVASALGAVLDRAGVAAVELGPGGRDTSRLAGSHAGLWAEILMDNADLLEPGVDALLGELIRARDLLRERQHVQLRELLEEARSWARRCC